MLSVLSQLAQSANDLDFQTYTVRSDDSASAGAAIIMVLFFLFFGLLFYLFFGYCQMKIFQKAGRKDAWAGFVPFYNFYVMCEVAGRPGWWLVFSFIPIASLVVAIIVSIDLAKSFGKDGVFGVVLLALLPIIGYPLLAFGDAKYQGPAGPEGGATPAAPAA